MSLEHRLYPELLEQLLAGEQPRCFWTPARTVENNAFRNVELDRSTIVATARNVFAGEQQAVAVETGPYVWAFTRIIYGDLAGVLVTGASRSGYRDPRLAALPAIFQFHSGRLPNGANLHRLMELVMHADDRIFSEALLFASENGKPFVLLHDVGTPAPGIRSWTRWPLERLFAKRRAAIITNPETNDKGLAIPFQVPQAERYVIVFALRKTELTKYDRDFLSVLQCVAAVVPQGPFEWRSRVYDRIEGSAVPAPPRLFFYGREKLRGRIEKLIARHGWQLDSSASYKDVATALRSVLQMVLIDGSALPAGPSMLRWLRRTAANTPILYIGRGIDEETEVLVDAHVEPEASDDELFAAIKSMVRELPRKRRDYLEALVARLSPILLSATSYGQLSMMIARCLVPHFADWAAVHLFDSSGELYRAEFPQRDEPIMREVPLTFLSGYAVMKARVDEQFFAELCEERSVYENLAALQPRSGAAIPLVHGGTLIGSLVALSIHRDLDEADFEGLALFAEAASESFVSLQLRADQTARADESWTRVSMGQYHVDLYRPPDDRQVTFRITPLGGRCIRVEATSSGGGHFVATLDVNGDRLAYETWHFPAPFHVPASGPVSLTEREAREHATGLITFDAPAVALISDIPLTRAIDTASLVEIFRRGLHDGEPNPAALLADIGGERFPFVAISFR
jgi:hypothetical protein